MEIELKYLINDERNTETIWTELQSHEGVVTGSAEEKLMHAVYFDAADERLSKKKIAVRVRREGEELVATVKWGGNLRKAESAGAVVDQARGAGEALHARPELNVPVVDDGWFTAPPSNLFGDSEIGQRIVELLGEEPLVPLLETKFMRRLVQIRVAAEDRDGHMLCEAAVDTGSIVAGTKSEPICELELELMEGDSAALVKLGEELEARYGLVAGEKSKFARGKALREKKQGLETAGSLKNKDF